MSNNSYKKLCVMKMTPNLSEGLKVMNFQLIPPKDEEVLVKNMFVGVNAADIWIGAGKHKLFHSEESPPKPPFDIGFDALGIVEQIGKNVQNLKVGQPVFVSQWPPRAYSEYLLAKPQELILVPELKPEFVSIRSSLNASIGLQAGHIKSSDKVLICSASGGTGHICIQLAKLLGCHVIGITSSSEKAKVIKELGCDRVINYKRENMDEVLRTEYPKGIDLIWETIGGRICETLIKHLAVKGRLLVVGGISGYKTVGYPDASLPIVPNELLSKNQSLIFFTVEGFTDLYDHFSKQMIDLIVTKKLKILLDSGETAKEGLFQGIESTIRAVEHMKSRNCCGKVMVKL